MYCFKYKNFKQDDQFATATSLAVGGTSAPNEAKSKKDSVMKTLVLDLDETLVHSETIYSTRVIDHDFEINRYDDLLRDYYKIYTQVRPGLT